MHCEGCGAHTEPTTGALVIFSLNSRGGRSIRVRLASQGTWLCGFCLDTWAKTGQFPSEVVGRRLQAVLARLGDAISERQGVQHG